jgi:hypothetical protein
MGVVVTTTLGLCIWLILWSVNVSGFDGILIAVGLMLVAICVKNVIPTLPGRRSRG